MERDIKKLVFSLVENTIRELAPAEAPATAPYGKYLFAPERNDLGEEERNEENTPEEQDFFDALSDHFTGRGLNINNFLRRAIKMKNKGWYSKILSPPNTKVYRYMNFIPIKVAAKILKIDPAALIGKIASDEEIRKYKKTKDIHSIVGKKVFGNGVLHPKGPNGSKLSSWSTKLHPDWIIKDLLPELLIPGNCDMLFIANTDKNFLLNPKGIEEVGDLPGYAYYQNEVLAFGPVQYDHAIVIINKTKNIDISNSDVLDYLLKTE